MLADMFFLALCSFMSPALTIRVLFPFSALLSTGIFFVCSIGSLVHFASFSYVGPHLSNKVFDGGARLRPARQWWVFAGLTDRQA